MHKYILWIIVLATVFSLLGCMPPRRRPVNNGRVPPPGPVDRYGGTDYEHDDHTHEHSGPGYEVCTRTAQVQEAIIVLLSKPNCSAIAVSELSSITQLDLSDRNIRALQPHDFHGFTSLTHLYLDSNHITSLPANVFQGLNNLKVLDLDFNQISQLIVPTFTRLPSLRTLRLRDNPLPQEIKDQLRTRLSHLRELEMGSF